MDEDPGPWRRRMTDFGQPKLRGPWGAPQIAAYLQDAVIPIRLAVSDDTGSPWVISLWFVFDDGVFWCATNCRAKVIQYLGNRSQCGFEVAGDVPPYRGIRGKGSASIVPERGAEVLTRLIQRYEINPESALARGLRANMTEEAAIRILPTHITSWDFTVRMRGAVKHS